MSVKNIDSEGIHKETCETWNDFKETVHKMMPADKILEDKQWIFRGILKSHPLETTLERICNCWQISLKELPNIEGELIREIERKAFGLGIPLPAEPDKIWWVSLMQHYGAPTRLLDFTYSPYIAAYFAFEKLLFDEGEKESAAVWAVQHRWTEQGGNLATNYNRDLLKKIRESETNSLNFLFEVKEIRRASVMQVTAKYLNDRITAQQGVFLCPTDITISFMDNFTRVNGWNDERMVKELILPRSCMNEAFEELRKMNIARYSLFPDFGGFAQSLNYRLRLFKDIAQFRDRQ
ncbi:MAG: FRG domain-containing protein [Syntrophorhabdaceae bacterium]|nr:FRG domain-containing protein [Syntrophorhabdaceae bacterium]MDD5243934.1 FRG domain-containing protein [Syntrophorhabdaceae bacterium]